MEQACQKLIGTHDFIGFSALKKQKIDYSERLKRLRIERNGVMLQFAHCGNGFLHKMVPHPRWDTFRKLVPRHQRVSDN